VKFDLLVETCFNKLTSLRRVRIKIDPLAIPYSEDLSDCPSYEGYVLEENESTVKILMLQPVVGIESVPADSVENIDDNEDDILSELKTHIVQKLELTEGNPLFMQIQNCTNLDEIELFLQQSGIAESDIIELYRDYIIK